MSTPKHGTPPARLPPPATAAPPREPFVAQRQLPPHPATVVQRREPFAAQQRLPPHPATVAQPKSAAPACSTRPPHPAQAAQPRPRPSSAAPVARATPAVTAASAGPEPAGGVVQQWSYLSSAASYAGSALSYAGAALVSNPIAGAAGVVAGVAIGGVYLGLPLALAGAVGVVRGSYNWYYGPTIERIPPVPDRYLLDEPVDVLYYPKPRDVDITAVTVSVRPYGRGARRTYEQIDTKDDGIHVGRTTGQEVTYLAREVKVILVQVPRGRRPTRYHPDMGDHTVAWTLMTYSLDQFTGQNLHNVILDVLKCALDLSKTPNQTADCLAALRQITSASPKILTEVRLPIERWQRFAEALIDAYLTASQLAREATYKRNGGKTVAVKNEATATQTMIEVEAEMRARGRTTKSNQDVAEAAEGLLDVGFNLSLGEQYYALAVRDWIRALKRAFPTTMSDVGLRDAILAQVLDRNVPMGSRPAVGVNTVRDLLAHYHLA